jgi:hypothetical protein
MIYLLHQQNIKNTDVLQCTILIRLNSLAVRGDNKKKEQLIYFLIWE